MMDELGDGTLRTGEPGVALRPRSERAGARWWQGPLVGFDLETTGTDPAESRIVSAALVETIGGLPVRTTRWLLDPGVPIPEQARAIHGISDEQARTRGRPAAAAVEEIAAALCALLAEGTAVVAFNAPFDLSLIDAELRRHGRVPLAERLAGNLVAPVLDALVIDRAVDRYRKGSRGLQKVCEVYGVELLDAHEAASDALAAVRVAVALGERYPAQVGELGLLALHEQQVRWYRDWAEGFQAWLRKGKDPQAVVDARWPMR
ncbi:exonuclease domain-containing protein [Kitasatospora sp. NBC_01287]|uniref:exonuclease domain-containing protein n=1 Tax=Kitasatospora sp. NBC_01287 TaxID=2903573 RepID=UPI00225AFDC8|nr:exonuclease domain-containing protein [Kitasatospora sp. NBC_01287]MCX4749724.1 exonuclease domain-containing protein [Kitasatospora sp. NBC_01287]